MRLLITPVLLSAPVGTSQPDGSGSALRAVRECYAEGGLRAFWRGIGMTLLRAGPVAGVVLPVNDLLLDWLRPTPR